jgi:2-polyprenyl-6-methoxyphenol hydroxylase-like FAD-dependent oxidoreductase
MSNLKIGIAGAGIGGLALAAALSQSGHDVSVFDQFDAPRPVGSGLVIQPVGQAVLARIGALDMAEAHGAQVTHMLGHATGKRAPILDVKYGFVDGQARHGLALHRAALFHAVHEAAKKAGARVVPSHEVRGVTDGARRQLTFANGETSTPFDLVVDASGAGSPLSPLRARTLPYGAIWDVVDWPENAPLPAHQLSQRYEAARRMVGVLPIGLLPGGSTRKTALFWSLTRKKLKQWQDAPIEAWRNEAMALWPAAAPYIAQVTQHSQMTPAFYSHGSLRNPVALGLVHIGDAAHRASPKLGQGAKMALLDGWALAQALTQKADLADALALYHKSRRLHLWVYQWMSAVFTPLYQSHNRVLPALRNHLLAPIAQIPPSPYILSRLVCGDMLAPLSGGLAKP